MPSDDAESNKQLVKNLFAAVQQGGDIMAYLSDDLEWWVPNNCELGGTYNKSELPGMFGKIFPLLGAPLTFTIHHITAEQDRVAVDCESSSKLGDGTPFGNTYHFLFIIKNGKISVVKEFLNTAYINKVLQQASGAQ